MKRKLTAEQEAARDARKAKFHTLVKQIGTMQPGERDALAARMIGCLTCDGRTLSAYNTYLLALQHPGATVVGGFRQWLAHGRCVKKGEHGSMIWIPTMKSDGAEAKQPTDGEVKSDSRRFIIGTMFDISQTQEIEAAETVTEPEQQLQAA